jgi:hypothetical protein
VTLAQSALTVDLRATTTADVTLAPTNNFTGSVALSVTGLPSDVTASFDNPNVTMTGTAATAKLTLTTLSSTKIVPVHFTVVGASGAVTNNATGDLTIKPVITLTIPVNADANAGTQGNPRTDAFGAYPIVISHPPSFPVTVNIKNLDSTPHEIHADQASEGFPHGSGTIGQNQMDSPRDVTAADTYDFYLHDEGAAITVGRIVIQ